MKRLCFNTIKRQFTQPQAFRTVNHVQSRIAQNQFYQHPHLRYFSTQPPTGSQNPNHNINNQGSAQTPGNQEINHSGYVHELEDIADWEALVIKSKTPVILDFYADQSELCKQLNPLIESVTQQNEGKFQLIKINIEKYQQIASALNVTDIPTVLLVDQGVIVDQFVGIPPEQRFAQFMQAAVFLEAIKTDPHIMESLLIKAQEFISNKDWDKAEGILTEGYSFKQWHEKFGGQLLSGLAHVIAVKNQDDKKAEDTLLMITEQQVHSLPEFFKALIDKTKEEIKRIKQLQIPDDDERELLDKLSTDNNDLQSRYELGKLQFSKGKNEKAIETLLTLMKQNKNWNQNAAYTLLLDIFKKMGNTHHSVIEARKKLSKILF